MKQAIIRIKSTSSDAEMLIKKRGKEIWKQVSLDELQNIIAQYAKSSGTAEKPRILDKRILAVGNGVLLYRKPAEKRLVFFAGKSCRINFPPAIYKVTYSGNRISDVFCWTYFKWKGLNTSLYLFPMPNMTSSERMCIGTADRTIIDGNVIEAVERIVDAEYTHEHVDNLRKSMSTLRWFTHLKKNIVKVSDLKDPKRHLSDLIETGGESGALRN